MAEQTDEIVVKLTAQIGELKAGMQSAADSVASANAQMTASSAEASTAMNAAAVKYVAALDRVKASAVDMRIFQGIAQGAARNMAQLGVQEAALDRLMKAGAISTLEYDDALTALNEEEVSIAAATAMHTAALEGNTAATVENAAAQGALNTTMVSGNATREYGALLDEALRGRYRQMIGTTAVLGNRMNLLRYAFSATGVSIIAVAAAIGGLVYGFEQGEEETSRFVAATQASGGALGVTADQFRNMEEEMSGVNLSIGHAKDALMAVAQTGRFTGAQIELVAKGAADMASVTGQNIRQTIDDFEKLAESPVNAVRKLNDQYHFLTVATFNEIALLEEQGKKEEAAAVAEKALADAFAQRAKVVGENLGYLQRAARATGHFFSDMWDDIEGIGRAETTTEKIKDINEQIARLQSINSITGIRAADTSQGQAAIANLEKERDALIASEKSAEETAKQTAAAISKTTDEIDKKITHYKMPAIHVPVILEPGHGPDSTKMDKIQIAAPPKPITLDLNAMANDQLRMTQGAERVDAALKKVKESAANEVIAVNQIFGVVGSAFDQTVKGVIRGTETWGMGIKKMGRSIEEESLSMTIRIAMHWLAMEATKKAASIAGDQVRTASAVESADIAAAAEIGGAIKTILAKAWQAASAVYASVSDIPFVGWILAPALAVAAGIEVAGFVGRIASAAGGWENVPGDQMAMVHKNEMVLPAPLAQAARDTFRGGGRRGGDTHVHVNAMDSYSMERAFRKNPGAMMSGIRHAVKMGHRP